MSANRLEYKVISMKTIAYFVTPHGFGHAARSAAIMAALQDLAPEIRFDIYTRVPEWFFLDSGISDFHFADIESDVGLVQRTPMEIDLPATLQKLERFTQHWQGENLSRLRDQLLERETTLVVCDIAPLGLLAAHEAAINSVLIENFTWDWIYEAYKADNPGFNHFVELNRSRNALADWHIQTIPVCEPDLSVDLTSPPVARGERDGRDLTRQTLGIADGQIAVLITMGGIPDKYNHMETLKRKTDCVFILPGSSDEVRQEGNLILLPHHSNFYHPDLIAASDVVIGKAGYSTIAEVYQSGKPFGYLLRPDFRESVPFGAYLKENLPSREIRQADFDSGAWIDVIDELREMPIRKPAGGDGAAVVANFLRVKVGE